VCVCVFVVCRDAESRIWRVEFNPSVGEWSQAEPHCVRDVKAPSNARGMRPQVRLDVGIDLCVRV